MIPKTIFTYWNDISTATEFHKRCWKALRELNPNWKFIILTDETLPANIDFPNNYNKLIVQHKADFLRLWLLHKRGGIWVDASILFRKPIDELYDLTYDGIQVYVPPHYHNNLHILGPRILKYRRAMVRARCGIGTCTGT